MVGKLKAGVWTGLGWEVEFVIQEVEVLPAQWGGHSTPNHEKDQMVGCSGEEGTLTAVGNLAPNSFHFFNHLNRQSKSSLHQHQGLLTNRWHCPLLPSKGCVRTSCSSSILFFLPARSLVQSMSEHQEYSKFIHSLGFCWCSKPPESGERHLKSWHTEYKPQALFPGWSQTQTFSEAWKHTATLVCVPSPGRFPRWCWPAPHRSLSTWAISKEF